MRIDLKDREGEKGRRERMGETLIGCLLYAPWLEIEPTTFQCAGQCSHQLSRLARAALQLLIVIHSPCVSLWGLFVPQTGWLMMTGLTVSQFWRLQVWNQGAARLVPPGGPEGGSVPCLSSRSLLAVVNNTCVLCPLSHGSLSLLVSVSVPKHSSS